VPAGQRMRKPSKSLRTAWTNQEYQRSQIAAREWPVDNREKDIYCSVWVLRIRVSGRR
jgi:hypothetical protein